MDSFFFLFKHASANCSINCHISTKKYTINYINYPSDQWDHAFYCCKHSDILEHATLAQQRMSFCHVGEIKQTARFTCLYELLYLPKYPRYFIFLKTSTVVAFLSPMIYRQEPTRREWDRAEAITWRMLVGCWAIVFT